MSLASIKRNIKVGTLLKLVRHDWFPNCTMTVHGNTGTTQLKGRIAIGQVRPVVLIQASQIALETPGSGASYLTWPKANCIRKTPNGFEIDLEMDGQFSKVMGYEFVQYTGEEVEAQALVAAHPTIKEAYEAAQQKQAQFAPGSDASLFWERVAKLI